jgi:hypothetical protein
MLTFPDSVMRAGISYHYQLWALDMVSQEPQRCDNPGRMDKILFRESGFGELRHSEESRQVGVWTPAGENLKQ